MNEQALRRSLLRHCTEVFATMLSLNVSEVAHSRATSGCLVERVVSLIGFGGEHPGNCMISCSKEMACKIASQMLMEFHEVINTDVTDAFGEISNMVFGNVKNDLEEHLGELRLSIPTVIVGREFNVRTVANSSWVCIVCEADGEEFELQMCVASLSVGKCGESQRGLQVRV